MKIIDAFADWFSSVIATTISNIFFGFSVGIGMIIALKIYNLLFVN
ncbi:tetrahydromethanopterin S-methyltransferase subunit B [Sporomusaceae bacterium BoRhaA]|nr:hypothetical protein [Pelorhabdus rhamnosifermentans]MBU2701113.1 tetrahydromethanopterin S-methyltransferase subunit B [Pelorhabdus rhamnosifermentans]